MAITGTPASGTITVAQSPSQAATYAGQNVIIPNAAAGIGDIVFKIVQNNVTTIKVMAGSTYNHSALTLGDANNFNTTTNVFTGGPMAGYTLMGVIYGFEEGGAMVVAPTGADKVWATTNSTGSVNIGSIDGITDISYAGRPRNCFESNSGNQAYLAMNIALIKSYSDNSALSGTLLHPTHVIHPVWASWAGVSTAQMSVSAFNSNTNKAKDVYKTYEAYLAQCKPMGAGGGIFSRKWHVGKKHTRILAENTTHAYAPFAAAQYCWNYGGTAGVYWLPDMVELLQLMDDATLTKVKVALAKCGSQISAASTVWSSVRYSATDAWYYSSYGFSLYYYFGAAFHARPVTLLKI